MISAPEHQTGTPAFEVISDGQRIPNFLVEPTGLTGAPAVTILHDWWGLSEQTKNVARRFASMGYVACAPDLYARVGSKVTSDPAEAAQLMAAVSSQAVLRDLNATTRALKRRSTVDPARIGVIGFSMGGTFALTQACHNSDLKAAVVLYGKIPPIDSFKYLVCPLQYHWPEQDPWIPKSEIEILRTGLAQAQRPGEIISYPGCPHGFFNEIRPELYRKDAAERAWQKTLEFFTSHLR